MRDLWYFKSNAGADDYKDLYVNQLCSKVQGQTFTSLYNSGGYENKVDDEGKKFDQL